MVSSSVRSRAGVLAVSGTRRSVRAPPFQRSTRSAWPAARSRVMVTSVSRVPRSSLRSRSVVLGADQTTSRSVPNARIRVCCSAVRVFGVCASRRANSASAAASTVSAFSPRGFQPSCDQTVLGVDGQVAAFGAGGVVTGALDLTAVLFQDAVVAVLQFPGGFQAGGHRVAGHRGQERLADGGVDAHATDPQVTHVLAVDEVAGAGAVVAGGVAVPSVVVDGEFAAARPAAGQPLQQRAALPDGAATPPDT